MLIIAILTLVTSTAATAQDRFPWQPILKLEAPTLGESCLVVPEIPVIESHVAQAYAIQSNSSHFSHSRNVSSQSAYTGNTTSDASSTSFNDLGVSKPVNDFLENSTNKETVEDVIEVSNSKPDVKVEKNTGLSFFNWLTIGMVAFFALGLIGNLLE